jgi:mono/diheme cytochrome c family protein
VKCHGPTGLGDGQHDDYDLWSKAVKKLRTTRSMDDLIRDKEDLAELTTRSAKSAKANTGEDRSRQLIAPAAAAERDSANLRDNMFAGAAAVDIFRRISGIVGTPMPAGGPPPGAGTLTEEEMWQIVDYVRSLPFG